jgi:predicted ester cyclase
MWVRIAFPTGRMTMDISATTRRAYELISAGDIDGFRDLLADDFVEQEETPGLAPTKEGVLDLFRMYRAAFPDLQMRAEEVLVSGDKTVTRVRATGTHQGELMGIQPTGKSVDVKLIDIMQFNDAGMMCAHWGLFDMFSMMQQLGAIPEGPPA